ncbi:MAG TPA: hypothetical protein PLY34_10630 [Ferruginibacter sp.]|nr:hypothetical protein [Ferruginibacter sp.]HPH91476.1 hypothetical protein [Ferruginibacter sp.]
MKIIYIVVILSAVVSCNSTEKDSAFESPQQSELDKTSLVHCYRYANENDTVILKLIHVGKSITGGLVYKLKEKDKNEGTIQGFMRDSLLIADYTFISEGIQSIRQSVFKLEDNGFMEGYGDIIEHNGRVQFKSIDSLSFNTSMILTEIPCR